MSNNEVKRWETISIDTKIPGTRFDMDDVPRVTVISADDHERIVAEKDREIQHWRGVYMSRPLAKCYEIAQEQIATQKRVIDELKSHIKLLNSSECQPYDAYYKTCEVHYGLLKEEFDKAKTIIDTQKRVIEKLKEQRDIELEDNCWDDVLTGGRPFEQTRATMNAEIAAIEKGEK